MPLAVGTAVDEMEPVRDGLSVPPVALPLDDRVPAGEWLSVPVSVALLEGERDVLGERVAVVVSVAV